MNAWKLVLPHSLSCGLFQAGSCAVYNQRPRIRAKDLGCRDFG